MPDHPTISRLVCLGGDSALSLQLRRCLDGTGWVCEQHMQAVLAPSDLGDSVALFVIARAEEPERKAAWVTQIRSFDAPLGGTPILSAVSAGASADVAPDRGMTAILPVPLDPDQAIAIIENWCGPLRDHGFRDVANPFYRLVRFAGQTATARLMGNFADQLAEAIAYLDSPDPASSLPHHLAGLAGMLGFEDLGQAWRAIDAGEEPDLSIARARTQSVLDQIRARSPAATP